MTIFEEDGRHTVKKFCLDIANEKAEYEIILNDSLCVIYRTELNSTKDGRTYVIIWYRKEEG